MFIIEGFWILMFRLTPNNYRIHPEKKLGPGFLTFFMTGSGSEPLLERTNLGQIKSFTIFHLVEMKIQMFPGPEAESKFKSFSVEGIIIFSITLLYLIWQCI